MPELSHLDEQGRARMVDVSGKEASDRSAVAQALVRVVEELDDSDEDQRDALLYDLVSAAWGTLWALDQ